MKTKTYSALALSLMCAFAHAQSAPASAPGYTLYGLIDVGEESISNVGNSSNTLVRMASTTGALPSRVGIRGSKEFGEGLSGVFALESGFAPDSGTSGQGGRLFGRQGYVGLSGSWGTASVGRQYTMLYWSLLDSDVIGPMVFGIGSLDSYIPNTRVDNSLAWKGSFSGVTLGATFSTGRDSANPTPNNPAGTNCGGETVNDANACREWSVMAKYDQPTWGAAVAIDEMNGGAGSWAALGLTSSDLTDRRTTLNGYYKMGSLKLAGGVITRNNMGSVATPKSDLVFLGLSYPVTPSFVLDAQVSQLAFKDSSNKAQLAVVRGTYSLASGLSVYGGLGQISNEGALAISVSSGAPGSNPVAGGSQTGIVAGVRYAF